MEPLEEYYNTQIKNIYDPEFSELPEEEREDIQETTHYAMWMLAYHYKEAVNELRKIVHRFTA